MTISQTSKFKDLENLALSQRARAPLTMISTLSESLIFLAKHGDRTDVDYDTRIDFEVGEHTDRPKIINQEKKAVTISTLSLTSTSELVQTSTMPLYPTSTAIATTIRFIKIPHKLLQSLVEWKDATTAYLSNVESEMALVYA